MIISPLGADQLSKINQTPNSLKARQSIPQPIIQITIITPNDKQTSHAVNNLPKKRKLLLHPVKHTLAAIINFLAENTLIF